MYQGIPSRYGEFSAEYKEGERSILAASLIFLVLIFLEFVTLTFGISLLFNKINAFQVVLHFIGCLGTIWQLLNLNQHTMMWSLMCFFGILPFILEVSVILLAFTRYHVIDQVEQISKNIEAEARARYQAAVEAQNKKAGGGAVEKDNKAAPALVK